MAFKWTAYVKDLKEDLITVWIVFFFFKKKLGFADISEVFKNSECVSSCTLLPLKIEL